MNRKPLDLTRELPKPMPASQIIYEYLLKSIIAGEMNEGQRIVESELAKMFGVSRSPIREALKMLEIDGLIELIPYRGVEVTRITVQDVRESLEIKGMVEGFASGIGAREFDGKVIEQLETMLEELEKYISLGKLQRVLETNIKFHHKIVESTRNEKLLKYYETLTRSIRRFYTISLAMTTGWKFSLSEHHAILAAIRAKDTAASERAARQHAHNTLDRVLARLERKK